MLSVFLPNPTLSPAGFESVNPSKSALARFWNLESVASLVLYFLLCLQETLTDFERAAVNVQQFYGDDTSSVDVLCAINSSIRCKLFTKFVSSHLWYTGWSRKSKKPSFCHNLVRYWPLFKMFLPARWQWICDRVMIKDPPHLKCFASLLVK